MKLRLRLSIPALLCSLAAACSQPLPTRCTLTASTAITFEEPLAPLAGYLSDYLPAEPSRGRRPDADFIRLATDTALAAEAFRLEVRPAGVTVTGGGYGGVFNGIQALLRLLPAEIYDRSRPPRLTLRDTTIADAPRFAYRGMMLDVARTWIDAPALKRYIDLFACHRLNKLHLHLTDDEGWRLEIRSHPELAEIGGFRGGDSPVRAVYGKWGEKYGGYFTQDEMRGLIAYAAVRNIELIPEIDLPGHSRDIASVHPEIRCNYPPDTVSTNGYDYRSAWCVAREENYALLEDILDEICDLFPSEYIHIGGDEVDMEQWLRCPDCRALLRRMGTDDPHRLQDRFMERLTAMLAARGKRPGVWNEAAATGEFTRASRVYGWQSVRACLDAAAKGYSTVVMPGAWFYFDMRQSPHEEGHDWAAVFDAGRMCDFDFAAQGFTPELLEHVAGVEGTFFSEAYVSHEPEKPDYLDYMLFPRVCVLERLAWYGQAGSREALYKELTAKHYDRMAAMGIRFRLPPPHVSCTDGLLAAATDDASTLWYTVDDGEPRRYEGAIRTSAPHRYRFFSRYRTGRSPQAAVPAYYRTIAPRVAISSSMGESTRFPYANAAGYKGLSRTRRACREGDWIRYEFERPVSCRELFLQTGNRQLPKTIVTTGYVEVSRDGRTFERAGELERGSIALHPDGPIKAVRIVSTCSDNGTPYVTIQPPRIKPAM